MAKKQAARQQQKGVRHPLIVYRLLARRFRPAAILLIFAGLLLQLPHYFKELQFKRVILDNQTLAYLGLVLLIVGVLFLIVSIFRARRAYVQCLPQYLVIHTAGSRVCVAYQRFNELKPVRVKDILKADEMPRRLRPVAKRLAPESALEAEVSAYPLPEKQMRRRLNRLLLSTRDKGFVFIVPNPTKLSTEIDVFMENTRASRNAEQMRYLDPIERMRYQGKS